MAWIEDRMYTHPKVIKAGPFAELLAYRAIQYSELHLTDGYVPQEALATLVAGIPHCLGPIDLTPSRLADILVDQGLWHRRKGGGFDIHDYLVYNPSRAKIAERRASSEKGGRRSAALRASDPSRPHGSVRLIPSKSAPTDPAFERFFSAYPRHVAKTRARAAWEKIGVVNGMSEKILGALEKHSARWRKLGTAQDMIPHPATWLNGKRWEDEIEDLFARDPYDGFPRV